MTTDNTRALVAQLREALDWCIAEISPATVNASPAIAAADRWLQQPEHEPVSDDEIREVFLANGFTIKPGNTDLKPYVFSAARALLALRPARVPLTEGQIAVAFGWKAGHGPLYSEIIATRTVERAHGITGDQA